jgi:hypothetical protein
MTNMELVERILDYGQKSKLPVYTEALSDITNLNPHDNPFNPDEFQGEWTAPNLCQPKP